MGKNSIPQGWGAGASRSRVFLAPWSRLKKKQEPKPEPLGKKVSSRSQSRSRQKISRLLSPARR